MPLVIHSTFPSKKQAQKIAKRLCQRGLAACVQTNKIKSSYIWQGKFYKENEVLLSMKTRKRNYKKIAKYLSRHHPYKVPEIIAFKIDKINKAYKKWLRQVSKR